MSLNEIRNEIDRIDARILKLLNDRMELALMARKFKPQIEDKEREKEVLEKIEENLTGLIPVAFIHRIYNEIIRESKDLQEKGYRLIAFQGDHGAFSEAAAREWNNELVPVPCSEFDQVFEGVESGVYDYGIVPVENTLGGSVDQVNQLLVKTNLHITGAIALPIHLCLLVVPGTDHREIRSVYSHPQALAQARNFLARNKLDPIPYSNTAEAARMLAEKRPKGCAAIASKLCEKLYHLEIVKEGVQDLDKNITRFLVLSKEEDKEEGNKSSVLFSTEHKAGTLFRVLEVFARESINLTRIESIPNEPGNYSFFLDFVGSSRDENVARAIERVRTLTTGFKLLGCYRERQAG